MQAVQRTGNRRPSRGFTLVELLVAIAIFAVMTAMGWKVFNHVQTLRDRNAVHEQQLFALQQSYQQMLRDTLQMVAITANMNGQIQPALSLNDQQIQFSKAGVTDPLGQGLSPYERVEYRFDATQKKLYRLKYNTLDQTAQAQPESSELLTDVEQFEVTALNPQPLRQWPDPSTTVVSRSEPSGNTGSGDGTNTVDNRALQQLPRGLRVQLSVAGTQYEWIFSLLDTGFLNKNLNNTTASANGNNPNDSGGNNTNANDVNTDNNTNNNLGAQP